MALAPKTFRPFPQQTGARQRDYRQSAAERGYDARWTKVARIAKTRDKWLCQDCLDEGILNGEELEADHVIPIRIAPELQYDLNNIRTRCKKHHSKKTQDDIRKYGNG